MLQIKTHFEQVPLKLVEEIIAQQIQREKSTVKAPERAEEITTELQEGKLRRRISNL
jgi:hypothetical protein